MATHGFFAAKPVGVSQLIKVYATGLALACLLAAPDASAQQPPAARQSLEGHVSPEFASAPLVGALEASVPLHLAIGLPVRNEAELDALLRDISDPKSQQYRHFLTPAEFTERFGPSEQDYDNIIAFATAHGLTITARFSNRLALGVSGNAAAVNEAFHIQLTTRQRPDGSSFYAPDREPSVDLDTKLLDVSGLDDYVLPQRGMVALRRPSVPQGDSIVRVSGSGPSGAFGGTDFRNAYAPGVKLNGAGQSVGLFEMDGFYTEDISRYVNKFKSELTKTIPVTVIAPPTYVVTHQESGPAQGGCHPKNASSAPPAGTPGGGNAEVALDIDMAMAMAPGLDHIYVYEGCNADLILHAMAETQNGNLPNQLSASWTFPFSKIGEKANKAMTSYGQTLLVIAGDRHATCPDGNTKSSRALPFVTVVGGTILVMKDAGTKRVSEIAAMDGGGILDGVQLPGYQTGAAASVGDTSWRAIPDVAMVSCDGASANPATKGKCSVFIYDDNGHSTDIGGTSVAAPLWAGYLALVNQWRFEQGGGPLGMGFINPTLYSIAANPTAYAQDFHDITNGSSPKNPGPNCAHPVGTSARHGYDLITGLGTPTAHLIQDLGYVPPPAPNQAGPNVNACTGGIQCPKQIAHPPPP
jgi:subtilase family serine protease